MGDTVPKTTIKPKVGFHQVPPRVAIVDGDSGNTVDIDGDGVGDLTHGEWMAELVKAGRPDTQIAYYIASQYEIKALGQSFEDLFSDIAQKDRYDAVIFSVASWVPYSVYQSTTGEVNAANISSHRNNLRSYAPIYQRSLNELIPFKPRVQNVHRQTDVYIAGGNKVDASGATEGQEFFSSFSLIEGPYHTKAVDRNGRVEPYSADNTLLNTQGQGTFEITQLDGGYDVNGDGRVDILKSDPRLSGDQPIADRFVGKPVQQVLMSDLEKLDESNMAQHLFSVEDLVTLARIPEEQLPIAKAFGDYAAMLPNGFILFGFRKDPNNRVVYDPDQSGVHAADPKVVSFSYGTSNVGPALVGKKLAEKKT